MAWCSVCWDATVPVRPQLSRFSPLAPSEGVSGKALSAGARALAQAVTVILGAGCIGQILTMPLFFASIAIYPIAITPTVLRWFARMSPLTYQVDILRTLMLRGGHSAFGLPPDLAVLIGSLVILAIIAARLYPRVVL